jgi:cytochrome b involved in lipid metabolism
MNVRILLSGIIAVIIIVILSYLIISPRAEQALEGDAANPNINSSELITEFEDRDADDNVVLKVEREDDMRGDENGAQPKPTNPPVGIIGTTLTPVVSTSEPATQTSEYTLEDVALHATQTSCWSAVNGKVYDLTSFIGKHPGGERRILNICGKDGSSAFTNQHEGQPKPESMLASYYIGVLSQ